MIDTIETAGEWYNGGYPDLGVSKNVPRQNSADNYSFLAEKIGLGDANPIPQISDARVVSHVSKFPLDGNKKSDAHVIVIPGFSESSAQFDSGVFSSTYMNALTEKGYRNPHMMFLNNPMGGLREDIDVLSSITLMQTIDDVRAVVTELLGKYCAEGDTPLYIVSHSMGGTTQKGALQAFYEVNLQKVQAVCDRLSNPEMRALPANEEKLRFESNTKIREKYLGQLKELIMHSPTAGGIMDWLHPRPLSRTYKHLPGTIYKSLTGKGAYIPDFDEHRRLMFGGEVVVPETEISKHFDRAVPASYRAFYDLAMPHVKKPTLSEIIKYARSVNPKIRVSAIESEGENLLAPRNLTNMRNSPDVVVSVPLPHAIPLVMNEYQRKLFGCVVGSIIKS